MGAVRGREDDLGERGVVAELNVYTPADGKWAWRLRADMAGRG
jgi:hypothetical protein